MQHRNVLFLFNSIFLVCFNNLQALTKHLLIVRNRFFPHISFILPGKYLLHFDLTIPSKPKGLLSPAWKGTLLLSLLLVLLRYQTVQNQRIMSANKYLCVFWRQTNSISVVHFFTNLALSTTIYRLTSNRLEYCWLKKRFTVPIFLKAIQALKNPSLIFKKLIAMQNFISWR